MKKVFISAFVIGLLTISSSAFAVDNSETIIPPNTNEAENGNQDKTKSKYSFTLFSFFKSDESQTKSDSVNTDQYSRQLKIKMKVNSDL